MRIGDLARVAEAELGVEQALADADVAIFFMRFLKLPDEEWQPIEDYLNSGKPESTKSVENICNI